MEPLERDAWGQVRENHRIAQEMVANIPGYPTEMRPDRSGPEIECERKGHPVHMSFHIDLQKKEVNVEYRDIKGRILSCNLSEGYVLPKQPWVALDPVSNSIAIFRAWPSPTQAWGETNEDKLSAPGAASMTWENASTAPSKTNKRPGGDKLGMGMGAQAVFGAKMLRCTEAGAVLKLQDALAPLGINLVEVLHWTASEFHTEGGVGIVVKRCGERLLFLDELLQSSTLDEHLYHGALVHPAMKILLQKRLNEHQTADSNHVECEVEENMEQQPRVEIEMIRLSIRLTRMVHDSATSAGEAEIEVDSNSGVKASLTEALSSDQIACLGTGQWITGVTLGGLEVNMDGTWKDQDVEDGAILTAIIDSLSLRVLVLGGGEGGTVRDVLKFPEVAECIMVEIDGAVVQASEDHLPNMSQGMSDDRCKLYIEDCVAWMQNPDNVAGGFDLIIGDLSDGGVEQEPQVGSPPAAVIFTRSYYDLIKSALKPGGLFSMYGGINYSLDWTATYQYTVQTKHGPRQETDIATGRSEVRSAHTDRGLGSRNLFSVFESFLEYSVFIPSFGMESITDYYAEGDDKTNLNNDNETLKMAHVMTVFFLASREGLGTFELELDTGCGCWNGCGCWCCPGCEHHIYKYKKGHTIDTVGHPVNTVLFASHAHSCSIVFAGTVEQDNMFTNENGTCHQCWNSPTRQLVGLKPGSPQYVPPPPPVDLVAASAE